MGRRIAEEDWQNAAISAGNLVELQLTVGDLADALRAGEGAVEYADRSGDMFQCMVNRSKLADVLHQSGCTTEARAAFREAEALQRARQPDNLMLYSVPGYLYCDILLDACARGKENSVNGPDDDSTWSGEAPGVDLPVLRERAAYALRIAARNNQLLSMGLDHLSLGRTWLLEAEALEADAGRDSEDERNALGNANRELDHGVDLLRKAGQQDYIPRGLLARAALRRFCGDLEGANTDLAEVESLSERCGMLCFQIDAALERCRWHFAQGVRAQARESLGHAKALVRQTERPYVPHVPTWADWKPLEYEGVRYDNVFEAGEIVGYYRRNPEIAALERQLGG